MANSICNFSAKVNSHLHTISFTFKSTSVESELDRFLGDEQNSIVGYFKCVLLIKQKYVTMLVWKK